MKTYKNILSLIIVISLISVGAYAEGKLTTINVSQNSVNIIINGKKIEGDNFVYNEVTYVPIRLISEQLSQKVSYDENTRTINITSITDDKKPITPTENQDKKEYPNKDKIETPIKDKSETKEKGKIETPNKTQINTENQDKKDEDKKEYPLTLTYATPANYQYAILFPSSATPKFDEREKTNSSDSKPFIYIEDLKLEIKAYTDSYSYGIHGNLTNDSEHMLIYFKVIAKDKLTNGYITAYQKFNDFLKPNKTKKIFSGGDHVLKKDRTPEEFIKDLEIYQIKYIATDIEGNQVRIVYDAENKTYEEF